MQRAAQPWEPSQIGGLPAEDIYNYFSEMQAFVGNPRNYAKELS